MQAKREASDATAPALERRAAAEALVPAVRELLAANVGGVSLSRLRKVPGTNADVEAAFWILEAEGEAVYTEPPGQGKAANYALRTDPAEPCRDPAAARSEEDPADPAPDAPLKEGRGGRQGSEAGIAVNQRSSGSAGFEAPPVSRDDDPTIVLEEVDS